MEKLLRQLIGEQRRARHHRPEEPGAGRSRPHAARAGDREPRRQRPRRDARGRPARDRRSPVRRATPSEAVLSGHRQRLGDGRGDCSARVRALLQHEGRRPAPGSGSRRCTASSARAEGGSSSTAVRSGSTFSVFLPLSERELRRRPSLRFPRPREEPTRSSSSTTTPMVRTIVTAMLEDLGYHVLSADGGAEPSRSPTAWTSEINLVLTDLVDAPRPGWA